MSDSCLSLDNIEHRYSDADWKLRIPTFSTRPGELTGIIGPNGAGKSTLLRIAAGVLSPHSGTVRLGEAPLCDQERRTIAKRMGYLPQETGSEFDFTVEEIVRMGRYPHRSGFGALGASDLAVVEHCLAVTEMTPFRKRTLSHLSGGERKRAFLASVLAQTPKLLLLDEPTNSLDLHHQIRFFQLLQQLVRDGMGVVIVTHEINLASLFCDRLLLIQNGSPLADGAPEEVLTESRIHALYGGLLLLKEHPHIQRPMLLPNVQATAQATAQTTATDSPNAPQSDSETTTNKETV